MAKEIKVIKCPQCGSIKYTQLKDDYYKCNSCGTSYFLDNDDININVNHNHNELPQQIDFSKLSNFIRFFGIFAGVFFLIMLILNIFSGSKTDKSYSAFSSSTDKAYSESIYDYYAYNAVQSNNSKILFFIERRYNEQGKKNEYLMRFYDPIKEKILNDIQLKELTESKSVSFRKFSDGKIYMTLYENNKIYEIDGDRMICKDISSEITKGYPELSSGLAKVRFCDMEDEDGFQVMSNDGKEYTFYPIAKTIYNDYKSLNRAKEEKGSSENIYYAFTKKSFDYGDEIQLLKIWYKYTPGHPLDLDRAPSWHRDFGGSGIFTNRDPHRKALFRSNAITRFVDLTPKRLYFEPEVIASDKNNLFIIGFPNANPNSNKFLQKIDVNTGKVLWTYTPNLTKYTFDNNFFLYNGGIVLKYYNYGSGEERVSKLVILDKNKKVVKELDLDKPDHLFQKQ